MNQPKDLLDIDTLNNSWNYSSLQLLKYLNTQKSVWIREDVESFFNKLSKSSNESEKQIQIIFKNDVPRDILINIINNTKTLLFT